MEEELEEMITINATNEYLQAFRNNEIDKLLQYIYECEFDVYINEEGKLQLIDLQKANLGNIEEETFETIQDVCERLEGSYFKDYHCIELY